MKKKILLICIPIILVIILAIVFVFYNKNKYYYEKLKANLQEDIARVLRITNPYCEPNNSSFTMDFKADGYYNIDKKKFLDIDKKSYCVVQILAKCKKTNQLSWDTYIKCNNYKDEGFQ